MTMSADHGLIPKIENFSEAQSVNPGADFTLRWNQFAGASSSGYINVSLTDPQGRMVFRAPNQCVPRPLTTGDTSVVIPANRLQPNVTYTGVLQFGDMFFFDTNSVPSMTGSGTIGAFTLFTLKTGEGGSTTVGAAANLIESRLLPNGNPQFKVTGTIAHIYAIERTSTVPLNCNEIGTVTIEVGGNATFEDTEPNKTFPLFYRAVAR